MYVRIYETTNNRHARERERATATKIAIPQQIQKIELYAWKILQNSQQKNDATKIVPARYCT